MQVSKLKQDRFNEIRKQMLFRTVPLILIAATAGIAISFINSEDKAASLNTLPFIIPLVAAAMVWGFYRAMGRAKLLFESYKLTITNNEITREQANTPTISIYFNNVRSIVRNNKGNITITGADARDLILIPPQVENASELTTLLETILPLQDKNGDSFLQKNQSLLSLLNTGFMICVFVLNDKIIVSLAGTAFIALTVWSIINMRNNKNIDSKTKNSSAWALLLLFAVIAIMIFKLSGMAYAQQP